MASIEIRFESDQDEGGTARLERWLVQPGETVEAGQAVAELETEKVTLEVAAPKAGTLAEILAAVGDSVEAGASIARLDTAAASGEPAAGSEPVDVLYSDDQAEGASATLSNWVVDFGAEVAAGTPLAEVETDKVNLEITAPVDGTVVEYCVEPGQSMDPGTVIARMLAGSAPAMPAGAAIESTEPESAAAPVPADAPGRKRLSPAVRRLARKHDLDLSRVHGTGKGGRVTRGDVETWLAQQPGETVISEGRGSGAIPSHQVPHTSMRRSIARHMAESLLEISPHVTAVFEADLTRLVRHRQAHKQAFASQGVNLTYTAYIMAAAARAMAAVPEVNARYHEDHLEIFEDVNIGIGTALGNEGLIVPVVPRVQSMDLMQIATALHDKTERARTGKLSPADLKGGTFTLSNHGVSGSLFAATIIINQPQVAILGVGKLEKRVKVMDVDGEDTLRIRSMCYVSLSIDHRALDAYQTNHWLGVFVEALENWPDD